MKKYSLIFGLMIFIEIFLASASDADGVFLFSTGGSGGRVASGSVGFEVGSTTELTDPIPYQPLRFFMGLGLSLAFTGDRVPGHLDYPCPHFGTEYSGRYKSGPELELYLVNGNELFKRLFLVWSIGFSGQDIIHLHRSNVTGWTYTSSSDTTFYLTVSGQLRFIEKEGFSVGVAYHNRRGMILGFGYGFF